MGITGLMSCEANRWRWPRAAHDIACAPLCGPSHLHAPVGLLTGVTLRTSKTDAGLNKSRPACSLSQFAFWSLPSASKFGSTTEWIVEE